MKCYICNNDLDINNLKQFVSKCIFFKRELVRYKCNNCGVIFGPIDLIENKKELGNLYNTLWKKYNPPSMTIAEVAVFDSLFNYNVSKNGMFLNYGAGRKDDTISTIRSNGYDCYGYDLFAQPRKFIFNNKDKLKDIKFDGIFSNNMIEHLQNPIEEFSFMLDILKPNGVIAHRTPCYSYCYEYSFAHLFFFTGKSLDIICDTLNIEIIDKTKCQNIPIVYLKKQKGII